MYAYKKNEQKNDFQNHITTTLYITEVTLNGLDHLGFIIILYHMGNGLRKMKYSYVHTNVDIVWTFRKSKLNKPHISPSTSMPLVGSLGRRSADVQPTVTFTSNLTLITLTISLSYVICLEATNGS